MKLKIKRLKEGTYLGPMGQIVIVHQMHTDQIRVEIRPCHFVYLTNKSANFFLDGWEQLSAEDK